MRGAWFLLAVSTACASTSPPSRPAPAAPSNGAKETRVLIPAMRSSEPAELFVDLGPVIVRDIGDENALQALLQMEADRLGADGFILEGRGTNTVYTPGSIIGVLQSNSAVLAAIILSADFVVNGGFRDVNHDGSTRAYVRAYRLLRGQIHPGRLLDPTILPEGLRARIEELKSLAAQMELLNRWLVEGTVPISEYDRARESLCRTSRSS